MTRPVKSIHDRFHTPPTGNDVVVRELLAVREIAHAFLTAEKPDAVYRFALERVTPLVGATFACIYLIDEDSDLMRLTAVHNWPEKYERFLGDMRVRLGFGPSGEAASERRVIEVLDVFADPALDDWQEVARELGFRSFVALPLQDGQTVLGTVTFYFASPQLLGADTRQLMRAVADQMAATAQKARLIEQLRTSNAALKKSNAELERQYAAVVDARRAKDEFLTNISHELRTPLTAVIGYISLMQDGLAGPVNDEQHRTLGQVKIASEQLLALIGDLLELTALKRGTLETVVTDLDPREPLRDAMAAAKGRRDQVELEIEVPQIVPAMHSDGRMITKALRCLLENAFKFTREGRVRVSMQVAGDRVAYLVQDTGIGIPESAHSLIFEEFRQVDGSLTREFAGSGLGLALARRLARLVQGDIVLVSSTIAGSTFKLELPLRYGIQDHS